MIYIYDQKTYNSHDRIALHDFFKFLAKAFTYTKYITKVELPVILNLFESLLGLLAKIKVSIKVYSYATVSDSKST